MSNTKLALTFRIFQDDRLIREDTLTHGVIKIGKVPSAHLRIDDESVSRMHAVIEVTGRQVWLIDLGSTRGTYVNGKKINKATLQSGDVLLVGDARVELVSGEAAPVRRPEGTIEAPFEPTAGATVILEPAIARPPAPPPAALRVVPASAPAPAALRVVPASAPAPAAGLVVAGAGKSVSPAAPPVMAAAAPVAVSAVGSAPVAIPAPGGSGAARLRSEAAASPAMDQRAAAEAVDEPGGARAVEVAAMFGDTVIGVKHCLDPRGGKITARAWAPLAAGIVCLVASALAFAASVRNAADNTARFETWTRVQHRPERAFRPHPLDPGIEWAAFGGLALGLAGVTLGLWRMRGERTSPYYRIGTAPGVEQATQHAPLPAFPLVAPAGDRFVLNHGPGIDGELIVDGNTTALAELVAAGRSRPSALAAGAFELPIPPHGRIRARVGQTSFVISAVARPRRHATPLLAGLEKRALSYVAGSLAVHLGIWAFLQTLPAEAASVSVDLDGTEDPGMRIHVVSTTDPPPEKIDDTGQGGASGSQTEHAQMSLPSGSSGNPEAPRARGHIEIAHRDDEPRLSSRELRDEVIERARREGILGSDRLISSIRVLGATADYASGFDERDINGPIYGGEGPGWGTFGGGTHGDGPGGGCTQEPCGTIGTRPGYGKIGTSQRGNWYWAPGPGGPNPRGHTAAVPVLPDPVISGSTYDKSIVRRYIRRHLNEIGYCYEKQLLVHPDLGGEVKMSFFISPSGTVQSSSGAGFDAEVTSCLAGVIKTIEFPPPGDGGGVQVNYPFHFHAPGR
ncbi:MAG TPA: AgmX/PglI C-terminal domain-containing protein [Kofleriaceae bacterium]|nr:AgmX/PglI C-terminal domain-containing protein [Kofleriaceae bacterium]